MPDATTAPLVILCNHRSGSSLFASLLHDAGLHLGELLPPAPDNRRGFFENRHVVALNQQILADRDADWTCPPPTIDHRSVDLEPLAAVGDELRQPARPWGFKDPRTLFTLPAWSAALGDCVLVGVHRNSGDVARSLAARGDLDLDAARAIADAYAERLAEAHRRLDFPIVSFDGPATEFVERVGAIATLADLEFDIDHALAAYEDELVHHRAVADPDTSADAYLAAAAELPIRDLRRRSPHTIIATWEKLPASMTERLARHLGPQFDARRRDLLRQAEEILPDLGELVLIEPVRRSVQHRGYEVGTITTADVDEPRVVAADGAPRVSHIVAPRLLDEVAPASLPDRLDRLAALLEDRGVIAMSGWLLDAPDVPTSHTFQPAGVRTYRHRFPHFHHVDEITATLRTRHLYVARATTLPSGRTDLILTNDRTLENDTVSPAHLRQAIAVGHETIARLEADVAMARERLTATSSQLEESLEQLQQRNDRIDELSIALASHRSELDELRARLDAHPKLAAAEQQLQALEAKLKSAERSTAALRDQYNRLARRRSVRAALAIARPLKPVVRNVRSWRRSESRLAIPARPRPALPVRRRTRNQVVSALRSRDTNRLDTGPLVSILIPTRDGAHHLRRLLPALDRTTYRSFEVVVVDNGSSDDTDAVLTADWSFPIRTIRHEHNTSFSAANNVAAANAAGELLLMLNNDIEPITDGWLGEMVAALDADPRRVAAGALLVYPDLGDPSYAYTVQHAGVEFGVRDRRTMPLNIKHPDPLDPSLRVTRTVPAVSAAVLLVRRRAFDDVGGFDPGYVYGAEDIDLCLKLVRAGGDIVVVGAAVLFHYESASQKAESSTLTRINRTGNWQRFAETWGPTLARSLASWGLHGDLRSNAGRRRTVAITMTHDDRSKGWGDYYTAHELGGAFGDAGWNVVYAERYHDRWYELDEPIDLVVSLLDSYDVRNAPPNAFTIAWVRNWVERWMSHPWFESYDLVLTSSHLAADTIEAGSVFRPPVVPLATNPAVFAPGAPVPTFEADYAFTGNNWGQGRGLIRLLDVRPEERFLLFGKGWENEPRVARNWRGHLDYELLPQLYRSVKVVLDDTAGPTLPHGFVNGRVFDALAAGALVITDNVVGSKELFDGALPTYTTRSELRNQLDTYLDDDALRHKTIDALRSRVLDDYTYETLPRRILEQADARLDLPKVAFKIGVPNVDLLEFWGDTHFARAMAAALGRVGFPSEIHILPDWDRPDRQDCDVVIHLRGLTTYTPKPAHVNVLWVISHPEDLAPGECDKYDLVLVASRSCAEMLAEHTRTPVVFMPQATDHRRFHPVDADPSLATELLFVGNSRRRHRDGVSWAVERRLPLVVIGRDWEGLIPSHVLKGDHVPNDQLPTWYSSAGVVLSDHWPDMRAHGFVSNRVFDVLASGGVVVTDAVDGLDDLFGDLVPTYGSADELEEVVRSLLADPARREDIAARGASLVAEHHTFRHRAEHLVELLRPLLSGRPKNLDGETF